MTSFPLSFRSGPVLSPNPFKAYSDTSRNIETGLGVFQQMMMAWAIVVLPVANQPTASILQGSAPKVTDILFLGARCFLGYAKLTQYGGPSVRVRGAWSVERVHAQVLTNRIRGILLDSENIKRSCSCFANKKFAPSRVVSNNLLLV